LRARVRSEPEYRRSHYKSNAAHHLKEHHCHAPHLKLLCARRPCMPGAVHRLPACRAALELFARGADIEHVVECVPIRGTLRRLPDSRSAIVFFCRGKGALAARRIVAQLFATLGGIGAGFFQLRYALARDRTEVDLAAEVCALGGTGELFAEFLAANLVAIRHAAPM